MGVQCLTDSGDLAETIPQFRNAAAYRVVRAYPGQYSARPFRSGAGRIWKYPTAGQTPGVEWYPFAAVFPVPSAAAAVPYPGL
jgi:hypothetical protein